MLFVATNSVVYAQSEKVLQYYEALEKKAKNEQVTIGFIPDSLLDDNVQFAQIILLRHGEPALNKKGGRKRKEAIQFIKDYDSVGIYPPAFIPVELNENELTVINTSSINRSKSTANYVFGDGYDYRPTPMFREFERKIFAFPNIKLPLKWWLAGSRVFWFMGLNKRGIERFSKAKDRAREGTKFLEEQAMAEGKTLLVSHGLLNHFLVKYLKKNGWVEAYDGGKGYLSQKLLIKQR
ncbi:MAG: histidine phosphatase family protein [Bacteroidota bacterium]